MIFFMADNPSEVLVIIGDKPMSKFIDFRGLLKVKLPVFVLVIDFLNKFSRHVVVS